MSTWILRPYAPDPFTGLVIPCLGWHVTAATVGDVMEGCNIVFRYGWLPRPYPKDGSVFPPIWAVEISNPSIPGMQSFEVADTDWMVLKGDHVVRLTEADVTANYAVTQWPGPPPPPAP